MSVEIILKNDFIEITGKHGHFYIQSFKNGFSFEQFNSVILEQKRIKVTNFAVIKDALNNEPKHPVKFGEGKEKIEIETSNGDMKATIVLNMSKEELDISNRERLVKEVNFKLKEKGIIFGIKAELFFGELMQGEAYIIAEGTPPVKGKDCVINMYEIRELKPETYEEGKVDFYKLTLIPIVEANSWLGDRIEAGEGTMGRTVKGAMVRPEKGETKPLQYDTKMVYEVFGNPKTVLFSKEYGAVYYQGEKVSIMNPLVIDGDVDFKTGNVIFDGHIIINGTVCDGFYVEATGNIEIRSELGIGNVKGIVSKDGSIYIKGGILSKGSAELSAAQNIYTKFVNSAAVKCGGTVHIGYDCLNSSIDAKEVVFDSPKGQIIGGNIKAKSRVVAPFIGSERGNKTSIEVTGFDKTAIKKEYDALMAKIVTLKKEYENMRDSISYLERQNILSVYQSKLLFDNKERLEEITKEFKAVGDKKLELEAFINSRGEGEIHATNKVFPNCFLKIKKQVVEIKTPTLSTTYFYIDGKLKVI